MSSSILTMIARTWRARGHDTTTLPCVPTSKETTDNVHKTADINDNTITHTRGNFVETSRTLLLLIASIEVIPPVQFKNFDKLANEQNWEMFATYSGQFMVCTLEHQKCKYKAKNV